MLERKDQRDLEGQRERLAKLVQREFLAEQDPKGSPASQAETGKMAPKDWTVRRETLDGMGYPVRKDPTAFLVYKERLAQRVPKEELVTQERWERQGHLESQVFLATLVSQERGARRDPEEWLGASDQWATSGFRAAKASRE